MSQVTVNNNDTGLAARNALNGNFTELYAGKAGFKVLAQSSVAVSCPADTTEDVLATITVPANSMGPNGRIRVTTIWTTTNSANNKTCRTRFGGASGTQYQTSVITTSAVLVDIRELGNRNAANSQVGSTVFTTGGLGTSGTGVTTSAVDTTADTTVVITGQKATAGEVLILESYCVELFSA